MARDGGPPGAALDVRLIQRGPIPLDVAFACAPGELLALVGPSGSGKSTVLRTIAGLYRPASGRIAVGGDVWFDHEARAWVRPQDRRVGLVFQEYALFPHLTAIEHAAMPLRHLPASVRDKTARELLARVHLDGLEHRRPAQLSGGQRQRVAIARALARDPRVLLLDEPFSAVDHMTREPLKLELATMRERLKIPIILVTHDLDEAFALADRVSILAGGRTLQTASPDVVRKAPASVEVARLIGETNDVDAKVVSVSSLDRPGSIRWEGGSLDVADTGAWQPGAPVAAILLNGAITVSLRGASNRMTGTLISATRLGRDLSCTFRPEHAVKPLEVKVPIAAAAQLEIATGNAITFAIAPDGIHLVARAAPTTQPTSRA